MNEKQRIETFASIKRFVDGIEKMIESSGRTDADLVNRPGVVKGQPANDCYILDDGGFIVLSRSKVKQRYNNIKDYVIHEDLWIWDMIRQRATLLKPIDVDIRILQDHNKMRIVHCEVTRLQSDRYLIKLRYGKTFDISERVKKSS